MADGSADSQISIDACDEFLSYGDLSSQWDWVAAQGGPNVPPSQPQTRRVDAHRSQKLGFLTYAAWIDAKQGGIAPESHIRYTVEWKVSVNNTAISRDSEQNVPIPPGKYWTAVLKPKLDSVVSLNCRDATIIDTGVKMCINDRKERDVVRQFDGLSVDWTQIESHLLTWETPLSTGKLLTIYLTFNYAHDATTGRNRNKRAKTSATTRMLAERDAEEEEESEQPPTWRYVYKMMRCGGSPCSWGPHCWVDPDGRKHHRLRSRHLQMLIKHVDSGGVLQSHDDVPFTFRETLYAEEQQATEKQVKTKGGAHGGAANETPPINIHFVPAQPGGNGTTDASTDRRLRVLRNSPGCKDEQLKEYVAWQVSRYGDPGLQDEIRRAGDLALADAISLKQIYGERDVQFFVRQGIKTGAAWSFVHDLDEWCESV